MATEAFDFLRGESVNQLWFWGTIRLVFERVSESSWYVDVHEVRLTDPNGGAAVFDAAGPPTETSPMLQVLKQEVADASAENGVLTIRFANGIVLEALPDDRFESWTVGGPSGTTQCMPGGELNSW
jgi:hypothetical protein